MTFNLRPYSFIGKNVHIVELNSSVKSENFRSVLDIFWYSYFRKGLHPETFNTVNSQIFVKKFRKTSADIGKL